MKSLVKLVIKTIKLRSLIIYFMSAHFFVMIGGVLFNIVKINDSINLGADSENIRYIFSLFYALIGITITLFLSYAFSYYIKLRMREYSLLLILGIKQIMFRILIFLEYAVIFIVSCISGTVFGCILSYLIVWIFRMCGYTVSIGAFEYLESAGNSIVISALFFVLAFIIINIFLNFKNLTALMDTSIKNENIHGISRYIGLSGCAVLVYLLFFRKYTDMLSLLAGMLFSLFAVYTILSFGISLIIEIIRKYNNKMFQRKLVPLKEFMYRFKANRKIMFSIYIINFLVLFVVNVLLLSVVSGNGYEELFPYEYVVIGDINDQVEEHIHILKIYKSYIGDYYGSDQEYIYSMSEREYGALVDEEINVQGQAMLVDQTAGGGTYQDDYKLCIMDKEIRELDISKIKPQILIGQELPNMFYIGIIPDQLANTLTDDKALYLFTHRTAEIDAFVQAVSGEFIYDRDEEVQRIEQENLTIFISTIIVGIFAVICCIGIVGVRCMAGIENMKARYETMQYLGMSNRQMKVSIYTEYNILLIIPVFLAVIVSFQFIHLEINRIGAAVGDYVLFVLVFQSIVCIVEFLYFSRIKNIVLSEMLDS